MTLTGDIEASMVQSKLMQMDERNVPVGKVKENIDQKQEIEESHDRNNRNLWGAMNAHFLKDDGTYKKKNAQFDDGHSILYDVGDSDGCFILVMLRMMMIVLKAITMLRIVIIISFSWQQI